MFSNVTILYFILLIPLAGFIAWAGDYIGHRTGKKRHSLFGLRPRHTALVFTIASGVGIVGVSFAAFWLFSESFRTVVRDGEQLYRANQQLQQENKQQAAAISQTALRLTQLRAEAERLDRERLAAETARNQAVTNAAAAEKRRKEADAKRAGAEAGQRQAEGNFKRAETDLTAARADLARARKSLTATENSLGASHRELEEETARVAQAEERLKTAAAQVKDAGRRVATARAEQKKAEDEANAARDRAAREVRLVRAELETQQRKRATLQTELDEQKRLYADFTRQTEAQRAELTRLTTELAQKRAEYEKLAANTEALRGRQITYQVGEEVDRFVLKPGMNVWRVQYALETFLTAAARKAEGRGAARGAQVRSVVVAPRLIALATGDKPLPGGPRLSTEADTLNATANAIREKNQDVLVRAVATTNAVHGEPVVVELRIDPNPVVLRKDARLGEILLNGEKSRQEIADAVYTFLSRDIHQKLLAAGMIPPSRGGEEALGDFWLTGEEWFRLIEDIRKGGSRPKLTVHAAKDLRAGDAVQLRFSVRTTVPWNNPPSID
jgi:hypothetical protein